MHRIALKMIEIKSHIKLSDGFSTEIAPLSIPINHDIPYQIIKVKVKASNTTGKGRGLQIIGLNLIIVSINKGIVNKKLNHSGI